jgi:peptidoglycan/xylan/chitin deacetylase (PgdA/CDA1 family)
MPGPSSTVYLMYHELELPGRALCDPDPGYVRYVVSATDFADQMNWLKVAGWSGLSVEQALGRSRPHTVAITFDDGCETDLLSAAPLLKQLGFGATFYITTGFLGKRGYLTPAQVRELSALGFDIGCHSHSHPYLPDLADNQLAAEISEPKARLEEMTGHPVWHFSCPGGRWDARVARVAREAGYKSVATSRTVANPPHSDPFALGRVAIMRGTSLLNYRRVCRGEGLWKLQLASSVLAGVKGALGNSGYDRMRALFLRGK